MSEHTHSPFSFVMTWGRYIIARIKKGNKKTSDPISPELIEAREKDSELTLEQMLELSRRDNLGPQFLLFRKKNETEGGNGYNAFLYFWDLYQKLLAIRDRDLEVGRDPRPIITQIIRLESEMGLN